MSSTDYRFYFSVIIPVYNMENYLAEAIESIIDQSLCFREYIQLVLVNDGSTDSSIEICRKYQTAYPNNVVVIDKNNEGVSSARNAGMMQSSGKFINFLDADDKWSNDAFECAYNFFQAHENIFIATAKHRYFERINTDHVLSYKYIHDSIVDIQQVIDFPHLSFSNAFVARSVIPDCPFDSNLKISEDFIAFNTILLKTRKYAVLADPVYYYRRRDTANSAIDSSVSNLSWYMDTPDYCYKKLFHLSEMQFGYVIPYVQYCVMYDIQWRIKSEFSHPLNSAQLIEYKSTICSLLAKIEDHIILSQRNLSREEKLYAISLKRNEQFFDTQESLRAIGDGVYLSNLHDSSMSFFYQITKDTRIRLEFINISNGLVNIEGLLYTLLPISKIDVIAKSDNGEYTASLFSRTDLEKRFFFDSDTFANIGFKLSFPLAKVVEFLVIIDGHCLRASISSGKFFPLSLLRNSYAQIGTITLTSSKRSALEFNHHSKFWRIKRELLYEFSIWVNNKKARSVLQLRRKAIIRSFFKIESKIWLFSDRVNKAGDNGEALFTYINENPLPKVRTYFVIHKDSSDYSRIKKIGKVVPYGSKRHKLLSLVSENIISSAGEDNVFNCFGKNYAYVKDIYRYRFVFLQHGIIKDDLSNWLNKYAKNIRLFITSSKIEQKSICSNQKYGYDYETVVCTGLARHDKLLRASKNINPCVIIAPTWRKNLALALNTSSGMREKNPAFKSSAYYDFYNSLINDPEFEAAAKNLGYDVKFLVHPSFSQEADTFNSRFCNIATEFDYCQELASAAILVTDYSSIDFDFALLKKPIIYTRFDVSTYLREHSHGEGYFDHESDGFGPIFIDYKDAVQKIVEIMVNPIMDTEYIAKVDSFFYSPQTSRCSEIVDCILAMNARDLAQHPQ